MQYCSTNGGFARQQFTFGLRKEENEALFKRRRLHVLNTDGDLAEEMKKEREKFTSYLNHIRMVSSMNDGNSEIFSDDQLSLNAPHVEFISKTLERYQGSYFTKEVLESQAHRAMNQYIIAYLHNRNNPDIEQACSAVLHIFSVCSQDDLGLAVKLESDISYTYSLLQIIKGDIRSVELIYNTVECLGNLNQLGFQRDRLFDESVADTVFSQLMKQLESPTADRVGSIAVQLLKLNFQEPLIYVLDILGVVYTTCDAEGLAICALLPSNLVSLLFNMYMDCQSTYRLKTRILDVLISVLDKDFMEQHFDFGNKDLFERLKKDFLSESVPKQFEPHFYKLFQEIVNFLVALFEYNDSATNIVISEDIKIEYILMESLVNRKNSAKYLVPIYQLINTISSFTSYDHLKQVLTGGEEWHVFEVYLSSIYDLPSYEKQAIKDGLKSLKNILELESMETNTEQPRPLYELCKGKHELVKFLHLHCESDSLEIYALKDSIVSILDLKE